jgi:hypothetical protein
LYLLLLLAGTASVAVLSPPTPLPAPQLLLSTADSSLVVGQATTVTANLTRGGSPVPNQAVTVVISSSNGTVITTQNVTTDAGGIASITLDTNTLPTGNYSVTASAGLDAGATNVTGESTGMFCCLRLTGASISGECLCHKDADATL